MKTIYFDIETIPCQLDHLRKEIWQPHVDFYAKRRLDLEAELAQVKPPANFKDPAKIAEWNATERPKKEAAIKASIEACSAECDAKCDEAWRRTSFDGAYCQIVVFGAARDHDKPVTLHAIKDKVLTLEAEAQLIRSFYSMLELIPENERSGVLWVGHNILDFDFRVLYQRSVIHGIRPPSWIPFTATPWDGRVFDTMIAWAGPRGRVSQDKVCRALGIDAKGSELGCEIDGSKVWDFVREGRIAEVATYCGGDVNRAREMHRRLTFAPAALQAVA